jgi:predicted amidohydrolase YtcJ
MFADLIVVNADVVTLDPFAPRAQAIAVAHGRIVALGDTATIRTFSNASTRVVDAGGRMVLPGLQDTHIHLQDSGYDYSTSAALDDARSAEALIEILRNFAKQRQSGWVTGVGFSTGIFNDANLTRHILDEAVPDRPCFIMGSDYHNACLNSSACQTLGLDAATEDPSGGHFVRDKAGNPTGMLHEAALTWAQARMPCPQDADYAEGVKYGQALANRHGITGVIDASINERHARVYRSLCEQGQLTLRVAATARIDPSEVTEHAVERVVAMRHEAGGAGMFKVHSAKFFIDGVFENRTAVMLADYSDAIGGNADLLFPSDQINELFTAFDAARFQIHAHVIGDGAVRAALDGLETARDANGAWPAFHQLAHIQSIDPADIPRLPDLGATANIQPFWARNAPSVTEVTLPKVGPTRANLIYAFRTLLDARADFVLSSDWGVSTLNPFRIMEGAITRQPTGRADVAPFLPEQRMTRQECLAGYTVNAAKAAWRGQETGRLAPGCFADLIVLDRDVLNCDPYALGETQVLLTLVEGTEVWRSEDFDG